MFAGISQRPCVCTNKWDRQHLPVLHSEIHTDTPDHQRPRRWIGGDSADHSHSSPSILLVFLRILGWAHDKYIHSQGWCVWVTMRPFLPLKKQHLTQHFNLCWVCMPCLQALSSLDSIAFRTVLRLCAQAQSWSKIVTGTVLHVAPLP